MELFVEAQTNEYYQWLRGNPDGFVISTVMLHRSDCEHISDDTVKAYKPKRCFGRRLEAEGWARDNIKGKLLRCGTCAPC